ncbi:hypothetical protein B0A48_08659 [Cryoendolithus antarcticus]|uniref:SET domain-containing protein n=1 Tax=Cryoendolithus antarcticus TaxID=1507870 RepID=A0A1V8T490_9PEZI|nr:hypothetical protein B0A48_08659 [Cryoendolithus antarcticus]
MPLFSQFKSNEHTVSKTETWRHSGAAYDLVSMFSHSCRPQVSVYCDDSGTRRAYAHRDIAAGEEIADNYHEQCPSLSFERRKKYLKDYDCLCELCTPSPAGREISDTRRLMNRVLRNGLEDNPTVRATEYPITVERLRIRDDVFEELSALPDREYNAWYTVHQFMLAILLDAEGLHIPLTIVSYARAAANLVYMADNLGLKMLPPRLYENVKMWTQKSEAIAQKTGYLVVYGHETRMHKQWMSLREVLLAVVEKGEIPRLRRTVGVAGF